MVFLIYEHLSQFLLSPTVQYYWLWLIANKLNDLANLDFSGFRARTGGVAYLARRKQRSVGRGWNSAKNNRFFSRFSEKRIFANGVQVHPCSTAQKHQPKRLKVLTLKTSKSLVQEKQCYLKKIIIKKVLYRAWKGIEPRLFSSTSAWKTIMKPACHFRIHYFIKWGLTFIIHSRCCIMSNITENMFYIIHDVLLCQTFPEMTKGTIRNSGTK